MFPFKLDNINYSFSDLEPYIDSLTMKIHYSKHYANYLNNLNNLLLNNNNKDITIESIIKSDLNNISIRNNVGGVYNHSFFWKILNPVKNIVSKPSIFMDNIICKNFGSFSDFKKKFTDCSLSHFGSGWSWVFVKKNRLFIISTCNQDNPLMSKLNLGIPILGLDLWEHAYYLKYQNRRLDYIKSFWNIINWDQVENNYRNTL